MFFLGRYIKNYKFRAFCGKDHIRGILCLFWGRHHINGIFTLLWSHNINGISCLLWDRHHIILYFLAIFEKEQYKYHYIYGIINPFLGRYHENVKFYTFWGRLCIYDTYEQFWSKHQEKGKFWPFLGRHQINCVLLPF